MPTPSKAYAAVAKTLADIDPRDAEAVSMFYRRKFIEYPMPVRALIADFLVGQTGEPSDAALSALKQAVALPVNEVPEVEAPIWNEQFGPVMEYAAVEKKTAASR